MSKSASATVRSALVCRLSSLTSHLSSIVCRLSPLVCRFSPVASRYLLLVLFATTALLSFICVPDMGRGFGYVSRKGLTVKRVTGASGCEPGAKASGKRQATGYVRSQNCVKRKQV